MKIYFVTRVICVSRLADNLPADAQALATCSLSLHIEASKPYRLAPWHLAKMLRSFFLTASSSLLSLQMNTETSRKLLKCMECSKPCAHVHALLSHMECTGHAVGASQCAECGRVQFHDA